MRSRRALKTWPAEGMASDSGVRKASGMAARPRPWIAERAVGVDKHVEAVVGRLVVAADDADDLGREADLALQSPPRAIGVHQPRHDPRAAPDTLRASYVVLVVVCAGRYDRYLRAWTRACALA